MSNHEQFFSRFSAESEGRKMGGVQPQKYYNNNKNSENKNNFARILSGRKAAREARKKMLVI